MSIKEGRGSQVLNWISCPWPQANLIVGNFCSVGFGVKVFLGGDHIKEYVSTYNFAKYFNAPLDPPNHPRTKGDVVIGNDVWIGEEATIMSGVTIGDGAIIGTKSVVASDVKPYCIVAGNPAKCIGVRFSLEIISRLLKLQWWNWSDEKIKKNLSLLYSPVSLDTIQELELIGEEA